MIVLIDKIFNRFIRWWREKVFAKAINCDHNKFSLVGKIYLINKNIKIGKRCVIYPDVMFYGDGPIEIGDNVSIGQGTIIYASSQGGGIYIGKNTLIAANCYIIDSDHGIRKNQLIREQNNTVGIVYIGEDVWIGTGCKILRGSKINNGAIIGAASLVKGIVLPYTIAVGCPARYLKNRV